MGIDPQVLLMKRPAQATDEWVNDGAMGGWIALLLLVMGLATGCSFQAREWSSHNPPGLNRASFREFTGRDVQRLKVRTGDLVSVAYRLSVSRGTLSVTIQEGSETLWKWAFAEASGAKELQFTARRSGEFRIVTEGRKADGEFQFRFQAAAPKAIEVAIRPNIELFGLMLQLDLGPDILANNDVVEIAGRQARWRDWYAHALANYERFKAFQNADLMKYWRELQGRGFYNDFFIGFLLQAEDVPQARLREDTDEAVLRAFSPARDLAEGRREAQRFLDGLNAFYREIGFAKYLEEKAGWSESVRQDVRKHVPPPSFVAAMERFYRTEFRHYRLVPSLNIPTGMGFGKAHQQAGIIYNVFGPFGFQTLTGQVNLAFDFPDKIRDLSVHEFGHSFANPAVDQIPSEIIKASEHLFEPVRERLTKQSYPSWTICLYEHFVRAGEAIIARKLGRREETENDIKRNVEAGFVYLPFIVEQLERYDADITGSQTYAEAVRTIVEQLPQQPKP